MHYINIYLYICTIIKTNPMAKETLRISYKFKNKRVREAVFTYSVKNNISVQQMIEDAMKNTHPTLYK